MIRLVVASVARLSPRPCVLALAAPLSAREESREPGSAITTATSRAPCRSRRARSWRSSTARARSGSGRTRCPRSASARRSPCPPRTGPWAQKFGEGIAVTVEDIGLRDRRADEVPREEVDASRAAATSPTPSTTTSRCPRRCRCRRASKFGDVAVAGLKAPAVVVNANGQLAFTRRPRPPAAGERLRLDHGLAQRRATSKSPAPTAASSRPTSRAPSRCATGSAPCRPGGRRARSRSTRPTARSCQEDAARGERHGLLRPRRRRATSAASLEVQNSNGEVTVAEGRAAASRCATPSALVELSDVGGPVEIENSNGGVRVRDVKGSARLKTSFGEIDASGIPGDATAIGDNGAVTLVERRRRRGRPRLLRQDHGDAGEKGARIVGNNSAVAGHATFGGPCSVIDELRPGRSVADRRRPDGRRLERRRQGVRDQGRRAA